MTRRALAATLAAVLVWACSTPPWAPAQIVEFHGAWTAPEGGASVIQAGVAAASLNPAAVRLGLDLPGGLSTTLFSSLDAGIVPTLLPQLTVRRGAPHVEPVSVRRTRAWEGGRVRGLLEAVGDSLGDIRPESVGRMGAEELGADASRVIDGTGFRGKTEHIHPVNQSLASLGDIYALWARGFGANARRRSIQPEAVPAPADQPGEPVSPQAKRALFGIGVGRAFSIFVLTLYGSIAFPMMAISAVGAPAFALAGIIGSLASIPLSFVNGMLADRLSPRRMLVGGAALLTVGALATAALYAFQFVNLWTLIPLMVFNNCMLLAVLVGEGAVPPNILKGNKAALFKTNAAFELIFSGVSMAGSLAGGFIVSAIGFFWIFVLYAAAQALLVVPLEYWATRDYAEKPRPRGKPGIGSTWKILTKNPYLLAMLGVTTAGIFLVYPLRITILPVVVKEFLQGQPKLLGFMNAGIFAGMTLASLFNAFLASKFKNETLLRWTALAFLAFGLLAVFPFNVPALFAGAAVIFLIHTVGNNVVRSLYMAEGHKRAPEHVGRLIGIHSAAFGLAISGGTWVFRAAMGASAYPALLRLMAIPYAAAMALYFFSPWLLRWARRRTHPGGAEDL